MIFVSETTLTIGAEVDPNWTFVARVKLVPVIVNSVPPEKVAPEALRNAYLRVYADMFSRRAVWFPLP